MRLKATAILLIAIIMFFFTSTLQAAIIYVKPDGNDTNNGSTWALAKQTIQNAINAASSGDMTHGPDEIWVKKGTYNEKILMKSNVPIYGGFAGIESGLAERNWSNNVTIIDASNAPSYSPARYHAVVGEINARLDGFTVRGGNANGTTAPDNQGGGMYNEDISVTVANCTFTENYSSAGGGAIYNYVSPVTITNCKFINNTSDGNGGGIFNLQCPNSTTISGCLFKGNVGRSGGGMCNSDSDLTVEKCIFDGNRTNQNDRMGGGLYNDSSNASVTNCVFTDNWADMGTNGGGGGIANNRQSIPVITNCSFKNNSADSGGGMYNYLPGSTSPITIRNCIFWDNSASTSGNEIFNNTGGTAVPMPNISYSDIKNCGGSDFWDESLGYQAGGNIDSDPLFVEGTLHKVFLNTYSPCISVASPSGAPADDIEGDSRDGGADYCDMGADEYNGNRPAGIYYVSQSGSDEPNFGNANGEGAWRTIHYAVSQINGGNDGNYTLNIGMGDYGIGEPSYEDDGTDHNPLEITKDNVTIIGDAEVKPVLNGEGAVNWTDFIVIRANNITIENLEIKNFSNIEPISKRFSLAKVKAGENFNRRNTLSILRIEI